MCHNNPSLFLPFACHIRFFASLTLTNKHLNRGMFGRYHVIQQFKQFNDTFICPPISYLDVK